MFRVSTNQLKLLLRKMDIKEADDLSQVVKLKLAFSFSSSSSMKDLEYPIKFIRLGGDEWEAQIPKKRPQKARGTATKLSTDLQQISENSRSFAAQHESLEKWDKLVSDLRTFMASMGTAEDVELSDFGVRGIMGYGYNAHLCAPLIATAFSMEGINALGRDDLIEATHCADRGAFWSSPEMMNNRSKEKLSERAKTGGIGKASRYEDIKNIAASLFVKLKPKQGWGSKTHAIEKVADEVQSNYLSQLESGGLKHENFEVRLGKWLRDDPKRFQI